MGLSPAQLATLKTELSTDPRGYGYATNWAAGNDGGLTPIINLIRDGTAGTVPTNPTAAGGTADGKIIRFKTSVAPMEIMGVIDVRDFISNANNLQAAWFESLMQITNNLVPLADSQGNKTFVRTNLDRAVGNTNGSQTRLDALAQRFGSRAEELFGTDPFYGGSGPTGVVTTDDISACRKV